MVRLKTAIVLPLLAVMLFASGVPVGDMSPSTLGIEYQGMIGGQTITFKKQPTEIREFYFLLRYAPVPYVLFSAGAGGSQFSITTADTINSGNPAASAAGGIDLFTPAFLHILKITVGAQAHVFNSSYEHSRYTAALLINPSAGVRCQIKEIGDIEAGAGGHLLRGNMQKPAAELSTAYPIRWYLSINLHAMGKGGYAAFTIDASPHASTDWSNGPDETSLALQIGYLIRQRKPNRQTGVKENPEDYFRSYDTMKKLQDTLSVDLKKRK